ncbi:MAG: DUF3786 domain-containing protein [Chloroflexota bacterium]
MKKQLALPDKKYEYGYDLAYELARKELGGLRNVAQQCQRSGAHCREGHVSLTYLDRPCRIHLSDADVTPEDGGPDLPVKEKLLVLHYFLQAKGTPPAGKAVTYQELKEGVNYFPIFYQRAIKPLVDFFGSRPEQLLTTARELGGTPAEYGDASVKLQPFPNVPVTLVLWRGDSEFPPEGSIMFDASVADYLTNDDIHNLCETIAWKLVKLLKAGGGHPGKRHVDKS